MLEHYIAVVFGGASNESEISVITGTMCANVLKSGGAAVIPVYISPSGAFYCGENLADIDVFRRSEELVSSSRCIVEGGGLHIFGWRGRIKKFIPVYAAINCCHGGLGEGGGVGGLFACAGIPMAGGDIFGGSAFLDKCHAKVVLEGLGVPVLPYFVARAEGDFPEAKKLTGLPAIIKPAKLGSSIGVAKAETDGEYAAAIAGALCFDTKALCESYLFPLREINCAACCIGGNVVVSECEEAFASDGLLSFDDKYSGGGRSVIPADIPESTEGEVKEIVRRVYTALDMRGIARFDFLLSGEKLHLSEVNTVPGSLAWYLFAKSFKKFYPFLSGVIEQAVSDFKKERGKLLLKTGILSHVPTLTSKIK